MNQRCIRFSPVRPTRSCGQDLESRVKDAHRFQNVGHKQTSLLLVQLEPEVYKNGLFGHS